jgi:hypothetical protein
MAKQQRINPEGAPERVFQPVASPVDLYFRPNLSQVGLDRSAQVVQALREFSPQLQRLTSDLVAQNIDRERSEGATEALQGTEEENRAKVAQAVEKAGGVSPWRYESFLDAFARRTIREKYQPAVYEAMDDLAAISNPDGTVRDPSYVKQKLDELYSKVGLTEDSYFINRSAVEERTKIDAALLPKIQEKHVENVKTRTRMDLQDEFVGAMNVTLPERMDDFIQGPQAKAMADRYYANFGESGLSVMADAAIKQARAEAAAGDYDSARAILNAMIVDDDKGGGVFIGGRKVGADAGQAVKAAIDSIEDAQLDEETRTSQQRTVRDAATIMAVASTWQAQVSNMVSESKKSTGIESVTIGYDQAEQMAESAIRSVNPNMSDADVARLKYTVRDQILAEANAVNAPKNADLGVMSAFDDMVNSGASRETIEAAMRAVPGRVPYPAMLQIREKISIRDSFATIMPDYRSQVSMTPEAIGLNSQTLDPAAANDVLAILKSGEAKIQALVTAKMPDIMAAPEGPSRLAKLTDAVASARSQVIREAKTDNAQLLASSDTRNAYHTWRRSQAADAAVGDIQQELMTMFNLMEEGLDGKPTLGVPLAQFKRVQAFVQKRVQDRLRMEWDGLTQSGLSPAERNDRMLDAMPEILADMADELESGKNVPGPIRNVLNMRVPGQESVVGTGPSVPGPEVPASAVAEANTAGSLGMTDGWFVDRNLEVLQKASTEYAEAVASGADTSPVLNKVQASAQGAITDLMSSYIGEKGLNYDRTMRLFTVDGGTLKRLRVNSRGYPIGGEEFGKGVYDSDPAATKAYLKLKTITGFTMDELKSKTTVEGLSFDPATQVDWKSDLLFADKKDMQAVLEEYNASGGESGFLAELMQATTQTGQAIPSERVFFDTQAALYAARKPKN